MFVRRPRGQGPHHRSTLLRSRPIQLPFVSSREEDMDLGQIDSVLQLDRYVRGGVAVLSRSSVAARLEGRKSTGSRFRSLPKFGSSSSGGGGQKKFVSETTKIHMKNSPTMDMIYISDEFDPTLPDHVYEGNAIFRFPQRKAGDAYSHRPRCASPPWSHHDPPSRTRTSRRRQTTHIPNHFQLTTMKKNNRR